MTLNLGIHALTSDGDEARRPHHGDASVDGAVHDCTGQRVLGVSLGAGGSPHELVLRESFQHNDIGERRMTGGYRPGLVQHNEVESSGRLQGLGGAEQHSTGRSLARAHHDRQRRR